MMLKNFLQQHTLYGIYVTADCGEQVGGAQQMRALADCGEQVGGAQQMRALRHDVSYRQNRHLGSNILAPRKEIIQTSR